MRPLTIPPHIQYIRDVFTDVSPAMEEADRQAKLQNLPIHIGAEEGKILQMILQWSNVKKMVEIGTLTGYSSLWFARAVGADGHVYTAETQDKFVDISRDVFTQAGVDDRVTVIHGDARDCLTKIEAEGPFDAVFIDADKIFYLDYLEWAEANVRKGGLIIGDNTFLFDAVFLDELPKGVRPLAKKVMVEFNQRLADPERYESMMIPTKEGITIARKLF